MADVLVYPAMEAMDGPLAPGASHAAPYPPDQSAPQIKAFSPRYKGLTWDGHGRWRVRINYNGKQQHIGRFADDNEAALAYDRAALHLLGEAAELNFNAEDVLAHPAAYGEPLKALLEKFQDSLQVPLPDHVHLGVPDACAPPAPRSSGGRRRTKRSGSQDCEEADGEHLSGSRGRSHRRRQNSGAEGAPDASSPSTRSVVMPYGGLLSCNPGLMGCMISQADDALLQGALPHSASTPGDLLLGMDDDWLNDLDLPEAQGDVLAPTGLHFYGGASLSHHPEGLPMHSTGLDQAGLNLGSLMQQGGMAFRPHEQAMGLSGGSGFMPCYRSAADGRPPLMHHAGLGEEVAQQTHMDGSWCDAPPVGDSQDMEAAGGSGQTGAHGEVDMCEDPDGATGSALLGAATALAQAAFAAGGAAGASGPRDPTELELQHATALLTEILSRRLPLQRGPTNNIVTGDLANLVLPSVNGMPGCNIRLSISIMRQP